MDVLIINETEVKSILNITNCIEYVENAHKLLAEGNAYQPLRLAMFPPQINGLIATMPAFLGGETPIMGLKIVTVFPGNHKLGIESHQASIMLQNPNTGQTKAILDGTEITAQRTAAASAVATKYLANKDSKTLGLIGTGVQAHTHLHAITKVADIEKVVVWNRTQSKAKAFVEQYSSEFEIQAVDKVKDVVENTEILCTLTGTKEPIIKGNWLKEGIHINAVGSASPDMRELDTNAIIKSKIFTDVIESALDEAGDIIIPLNEGKITTKVILAELGDLVIGKIKGRENSKDITLYKSLGVGIQDLAVANYVFSEAKKRGFGKNIEM